MEVIMMISMTSLCTAVVAVTVLILSVILVLARGGGQSSRLPPGPRGLPLIGSLHQMGAMPHVWLSLMAERHGPLMSVRLGRVVAVVASSPEVAREVLHKNDQSFADRPVPDAVASQPHVEGTLAWVPGDHRWRARRRFCTAQMFTAARLDSLRHLRLRNVTHLINHIKMFTTISTPVGTQDHLLVQKASAVDIGALAFATTLNLISNTVFSTDIVDPDFSSAGEFKELVWRIMEMAGKPNLSDYFPAIKRLDLQGVRRSIKPSYLRLHHIFDVLIEKRLRDRSATAASAGDFLDLLLDASDFNIDTIKPLILDLFIAGSDTSGSTTEWAMAEMLRNPKILQKLTNEVRKVIGSDGEVSESNIHQLPYLQAVIKETLRLHPSAPLLLPYVAGNDVVVSGYTVPKGTHVMINAWLLGRSPKYWDEALVFMPERFMESELEYKGRDYEYIPFGAGRRICQGLPLAERMVKLMLGSLVHAFDWELPEGTTPESLDMTEQFGITLKKAVSLRAVPILK